MEKQTLKSIRFLTALYTLTKKVENRKFPIFHIKNLYMQKKRKLKNILSNKIMSKSYSILIPDIIKLNLVPVLWGGLPLSWRISVTISEN